MGDIISKIIGYIIVAVILIIVTLVFIRLVNELKVKHRKNMNKIKEKKEIIAIRKRSKMKVYKR